MAAHAIAVLLKGRFIPLHNITFVHASPEPHAFTSSLSGIAPSLAKRKS